jgi:DNA-directed RNA polymerase I, II, and III subunit RPABC2
MQKSVVLSSPEEYIKLENNEKITRPFITLYEKTRVISVRAQMISNGAIPLIPIPINITDSSDIAILEYEKKKIPFIIRRTFPDNSYEDWRFVDLIDNL